MRQKGDEKSGETETDTKTAVCIKIAKAERKGGTGEMIEVTTAIERDRIVSEDVRAIGKSKLPGPKEAMTTMSKRPISS